jgi:Zn-dependent protease with chaperone function
MTGYHLIYLKVCIENFIPLMRFLGIFIIVFFQLALSSQGYIKSYSRIKNYRPDQPQMKKTYAGFDSLYKTLEFSARKEDKSIKEAFDGIKKTLASFDKDSLLMKKDPVTDYLQKITDRICRSNPILNNRRLNVFVYRTSVPNAANYGSGVILFNLNLLAKFNSEEDVAFILSHEIAHDLKGHVVEGIRKNYQLQNDNELKKKFEKAQKEEFYKIKSYEEYVASYLQRYTSKKRVQEMQADSLGLCLYGRAGYDIGKAFETMRQLDSVDADIPAVKLDYQKELSFEGFDLKKAWLQPEEQEETITGGNLTDIKFPDSLKTHPDCQQRLSNMKNVKVKTEGSPGLAGNFKQIKYFSQLEMLEVFLQEYELSQGFYQSLQLNKLYPDNTYLKCSVIEFLYEIYYAKTTHYYSQVVDKPNQLYSQQYVECLNLLGNMNPENVKLLMEYYFKNNFSSQINDPYAAYVLSLLKSIGKQKEKRFELINEYEKTFGLNYYSGKLRAKFIQKK